MNVQESIEIILFGAKQIRGYTSGSFFEGENGGYDQRIQQGVDIPDFTVIGETKVVPEDAPKGQNTPCPAV